MHPIDLTGQKIGRWKVLERAQNTKVGGTQWLCRCDCGSHKIVNGIVLRDRRSRSCGCLHRDSCIKRSTKHGHATNGITPTYHSWAGMIARCKQGIRYYEQVMVCERWRDFRNFLEDMGEKPKSTSIERIDNSKGYSPDNCKWADAVEQANNQRSNRRISFNGESLTLIQWARKIGINQSSLRERLDKWSLERSLTESSHKKELR